ncbi:bifunctional nuclease family protein (plasmid) [Haladaptatus sp. SPP-AMP-3]|uniref:bifunctional nuclease family protein n=1 Tax=Haladaptatus sp. SPP-AMP-3 TaxID=3121295 RepID=UPI003C2EFCF6
MDVTIDAVRVAATGEGPLPVVVLAPEDGDDVLPIFIRFEEGISIARGMEAEDIGRPLTHDLLLDVMEELGGRIERVVVTGLDDNTYIADLHIQTPRGHEVVDARPSDSLALAARTGAPIEVADEVFDHGHQERAQFDDLQDIREVAQIGQ